MQRVYTIIVLLFVLHSAVHAQGRPDIRWMKGFFNLRAFGYNKDGSEMVRVGDQIQVVRTADDVVLRTYPIKDLSNAASAVGVVKDPSNPTKYVVCAAVYGIAYVDRIAHYWLRLYDTTNGSLLWNKEIFRYSASFDTIDFITGGTLLFLSGGQSYNQGLVFRLSDGEQPFTIDFRPNAHIGRMPVSPDGSRIASFWGQGIDIFSLTTGQRIGGWSDAGYTSSLFAITPDNAGLIRAASNGYAFETLDRVVSTSTGGNLSTFPTRTFSNSQAGYLPGVIWQDATTFLALAMDDGNGTFGGKYRVYIDSFSTGGTRNELHHFDIPLGIWPAYQLNPAKPELALGGNISALVGSYLGFFDMATSTLREESGPRDPVSSVSYSPNGRVVATSGGSGGHYLGNPHGVRLYDRLSGAHTGDIDTPDGVYRSVFAPDGTKIATAYGAYAAVLGRREADVWNLDGTLYRHLPSGYYAAQGLSFSRDSRYLATVDGDNVLRIWDLQNATSAPNAVLASSMYLPQGAYSVRCSPTEQMVAVGYGGSALFLSLPALTNSRPPVNLPVAAADLSFSRDGKILFAAGSGRVMRINLTSTSATVAWTVTFPDEASYQIAAEPTGRYVLSSFDSTTGSAPGHVRILRASDGAVVKSYDEETGYAQWYAVLGAAWSPDGEGISYSRYDGVVVNARHPYYTLPKLKTLGMPASLGGGAPATGSVTLDGPAPVVLNEAYVDGAVVSLTSSNPSLLQVPSTTTVTGPLDSVTFSITTSGVTIPTVVRVTATYNGVSKFKDVTINPPALSAVSATTVTGVAGYTSTGTVTLTGAPATGSGITVTLTSSSPAVTVPINVIVPDGATTKTFDITTNGVTAQTTAIITASYFNGVTTVKKTVTLTVKPAALSSITLNPTTVKGGTSSTATVTLTGKAPVGGYTVTLTSGNAAAQVPASVAIPEGQSSAQFVVTTSAVAVKVTVTLTATPNTGSAKVAKLTVTP